LRAVAATPDYATATWSPASAANYSVADRPHDYGIDMIVIHDIEGTSGAAIATFQDPKRAGSAHYVIGYDGAITQMVQEKDIAWHAGNWDYNTRSIGIEHAGFACCDDYTQAEYDASAQLIASICSRWGVTLDRTHVIGHYQVPDPTDGTKFGGIDHHTDPGSQWDWTSYMALAQQDAAALPSPPHLGPDPVASVSGTTATVRWRAARACHSAVASYTVTEEPGGVTKTLPASAVSTTFSGLHVGTTYSFTVKAVDADGSDSLTSNSVVPGSKCTSVAVHVLSPAPRVAGSPVSLRATAGGCPSPQFEYWVRMPNGKWYVKQAWTAGGFTWDTSGLAPGRYVISAWAVKLGDSTAKYEAYSSVTLTLTGCTSAKVTPVVASAQVGSPVTFTASAGGCPSPVFEFWLEDPTGKWKVMQAWGAGTWTWDTSGFAKGTYHLSVWANSKGSYVGRPQKYATATATLT
jgi:hypothetical protein